MDPLALGLLSAFGGVTVTAFAGLLGAWIQSRRERARWLFERRYAAYLALLEELDLNDDANVERVRRVSSEIALLGPESLGTPMGRFIQADTLPDQYDRGAARTRYLNAVRKALKLTEQTR